MFTEKFALLNLLKAIQSISPDSKPEENGKTENLPPTSRHPSPERAESHGAAPAPVQNASYTNVMEEVLKRHEQISNRVKNKKPSD